MNILLGFGLFAILLVARRDDVVDGGWRVGVHRVDGRLRVHVDQVFLVDRTLEELVAWRHIRLFEKRRCVVHYIISVVEFLTLLVYIANCAH